MSMLPCSWTCAECLKALRTGVLHTRCKCRAVEMPRCMAVRHRVWSRLNPIVLACTAGSTLNHWPFPANHLAEGYAYIITHPGSPCIFYDHFFAEGLGQTIRELIKIRSRLGIQCRSKVWQHTWRSAIGCFSLDLLRYAEWKPACIARHSAVLSSAQNDVWSIAASLHANAAACQYRLNNESTVTLQSPTCLR